jgi:hypothetical protein
MKPLTMFLSLCVLSLNVWAQDRPCPHFSRWVKHRLKKEARWLVSKSLQKRIAERSPAFGSLVQLQQCSWLESGFLDEEGRYFIAYLAADGVPLAAMFGRYRGIWTMALVPYDGKGKMPEANLLEITDRKWTLSHRDKDGSRTILAMKKY